MPAYEEGGFAPPAPVVRARVFGPGGASYPDVPLLIDIGAAISAIPSHIASAVGAEGRPSESSVEFYSGETTGYLEADLRIEFLH